jgi:uncharacterized protein YqcC (DUF446 family)
MSLTDEQQHWQLMRKMEQLIDSNLKLADAVAAQTMAIHALAASNEQIVDVIASAAVDNQVPADILPLATSLDQTPETIADRNTF